MKTMFGFSLPPVICRRAHGLFTLFVFFAYSAVCLLFFHFCLYAMLSVSLYSLTFFVTRGVSLITIQMFLNQRIPTS